MVESLAFGQGMQKQFPTIDIVKTGNLNKDKDGAYVRYCDDTLKASRTAEPSPTISVSADEVEMIRDRMELLGNDIIEMRRTLDSHESTLRGIAKGDLEVAEK